MDDTTSPPSTTESSVDEVDEVDEVRRMTARLKLDVRRPSVQRWKAENEGGAFVSRLKSSRVDEKIPSSMESSTGSKRKFAGRFEDLSDAIEWIKQELISLKEQDYDLARQLIRVRTELSHAKLKRSCSQHRALLEDATLDMELQRNDEHDDDILDDLPTEFGRCPLSLRGIGITRMNLCSRRFSLS